MPNIIFVGDPPDRAITDWEYSGIDDSLYTIHLECGHYWAGLTYEMPEGDTFPCGQCTLVDLDEPPIKQLSLFGEDEHGL